MFIKCHGEIWEPADYHYIHSVFTHCRKTTNSTGNKIAYYWVGGSIQLMAFWSDRKLHYYYPESN